MTGIRSPTAGPTRTHTYGAAGNYTVKLTVTDNEGCSKTRVFTGQTASCNGGTAAEVSQLVTVAAASTGGGGSGGGDGGGGSGGTGGGGGGSTPPDNDIEIGKAKANTKNGSAKLPVEVPGAGELELTGKGLKPATKEVDGEGTVNLNVKPSGKVAKKLDDKGKATVNVEVTFTPTGGEANSESAKVKLKEK